jgi:YHS domain-containing protein
MKKLTIITGAIALFSFTSCSSNNAQQVSDASAGQDHGHNQSVAHESHGTTAGMAQEVGALAKVDDHHMMASASAPGTAAQNPPTEEGISRDLVCMVNNAFMGRKQIPVEFENKTYYGCCEMCVAKIQNNREARYATDPVTGKEVDKAQAFIVLKPGTQNGDVLYFESEETHKRYKPKT